MNFARLLTCLIAAIVLQMLAACSSLSEEERTARLERKLQKKEEVHRERMKRKAMRARSEDDRYDEWWDAVMGRGTS
ncbi:MAG: hypothetical protein ACR2OZ_05680 [Verrucomicrobiales bacterium]